MTGRVAESMWAGTISYRHDRDGEQGRERYLRTAWKDGTTTFRAFCELDMIGMARDVTHTVDARSRPIDCYCRLQWEGRTSMGWFLFGDNEILCESLIPDLGRVSQRVAVPERPVWFGSHPVVSDGLIVAAYDTLDGPGPLPGWISSRLHTGSDGPMAMPYLIEDFRLLGEEEIEVPAGRFACRRFRMHYDGGQFQDLWVDAMHQTVKLRSEELGLDCVLVSHEQVGP